MKKRQRTLTTDRKYFGVDAARLREGSGRVLSRVVGLAPERARVRAHHVRQDFGLDTIQGQALVDNLVAEGLLRPRYEQPDDYFLTSRFVEVASARVVEPLPRIRAKLIAGKAAEIAARINAESKRNPLTIEMVAIYGSYMTLDDSFSELEVAIVVCPREPVRRLRFWSRMTKADGATAIRKSFQELSSFVQPLLVSNRRLVPRPFAVVFEER